MEELLPIDTQLQELLSTRIQLVESKPKLRKKKLPFYVLIEHDDTGEILGVKLYPRTKIGKKQAYAEGESIIKSNFEHNLEFEDDPEVAVYTFKKLNSWKGFSQAITII